ncbi:MAG: gliding motility-associated C-terminal domain-containing protein, partial [Cyclobacteriaceae bacterium]
PDGDSLSFEFAIPKKEKGQFVNGYRDPNEPEFYNSVGLSYAAANEDQDGPPTFTIDPQTGTIVWDAPGAPGEYNIAFLIKEWRKIRGAWILLGYVTRDMQIIVEDCDNQRPELLVPADICVDAGTVINQEIFGFDPDNDSVKIEAFSQLFGISPSPATFTPNPPKFQSTSPPDQAISIFNWETKCEHIKSQPYQVVFKISDKSSSGPSLVSFQTWNITVVGPAPTWVDAQVDLGNRATDLEWDPYPCANAEVIQIWRRVDQFTFTPPECVTGMPSFLGYTKIAEVPGSATTYRDDNGGKGLAPGAAYCYRLVAAFPFPGGGESYVSDEICIPPILADAPVITNVTIDRTSTDGQITVKWRSPFDADEVQFPPPYTFEVLRAEGFSGALQIIKPHPGQLTDSTYVDTGLNTEEIVYNYRIVAYDANNTKIDTSATASSVRLEAGSEFKQISLTWAADVPWSNKTQDYPRHLIFRGPVGATEAQLTLIDSVNVNEKQFTYVDEGQWNGVPLEDTEIYCYRVMTRGSYGNPEIDEPLLNFSQIICAQPNDSIPPCTPELEIIAQNCDEFFTTNSCDPQTFSNTLQWRRPEDPVCRADIRSYNIYKADKIGDPFDPYVTNVKDTFFIDTNLPSFARCYKITAVD